MRREQPIMNSRRILWSALGAIVLFAVIAGAWIFSLPAAPSVAAPPAVAQDERDAVVAALQPAQRRAARGGPAAPTPPARTHQPKKNHPTRTPRLPDALRHPHASRCRRRR